MSSVPPAEQYTHTGQRFLLGYGPDYYGIWDRTAPGQPIRRYARSDAGWNEAWRDYSAWEPQNAPVTPPAAQYTPPPAAQYAPPPAAGPPPASPGFGQFAPPQPQYGAPAPSTVGAAKGLAITAGVLEIVIGALQVIAGVLILGAASDVGPFGGLVGGIAAIVILFGAADVLAGILILRKSNGGRVLAFVMSGLGVVFAVVQFGQEGGAGSAAIGLLIRVVVIVLLAMAGPYFRKSAY